MPDDPPFPDPDDALVLDPGCARCPALAAGRTEIAWGNGPRDADVLVVGEAPAAGDPDAAWAGGNHTGLAYTSRHSGRRVRRLVSALGLDGRAFYTNAVKCFPSAAHPAGAGESGADGVPADAGPAPDADPPDDRDPTPAERGRCREHLLAELDAVDPTAALATGRHATASLLSAEGRELGGFVERVATVERLPTLGVAVVPALHPAYAPLWRARLGYADAAAYRAALADALRAAGVEDVASPEIGEGDGEGTGTGNGADE
ncbi:MAG: uracil-DNA glycosylase family protein [Haloferacaceae archaeon]